MIAGSVPSEIVSSAREKALRRTDFWGWILFLLCAVAFTAAGVRDGDVLVTGGSVLFVVACVLFLVPYVRK